MLKKNEEISYEKSWDRRKVSFDLEGLVKKFKSKNEAIEDKSAMQKFWKIVFSILLELL